MTPSAAGRVRSVGFGALGTTTRKNGIPTCLMTKSQATRPISLLVAVAAFALPPSMELVTWSLLLNLGELPTCYVNSLLETKYQTPVLTTYISMYSLVNSANMAVADMLGHVKYLYKKQMIICIISWCLKFGAGIPRTGIVRRSCFDVHEA